MLNWCGRFLLPLHRWSRSVVLLRQLSEDFGRISAYRRSSSLYQVLCCCRFACSFKFDIQFVTGKRGLWLSSFCVLPLIHAAVVSKDKRMADTAKVEDIVKQADELYSQNAVDELYTYMKQFMDSTEADVLWRLARATCDKAKSTADKAVRKELMYDAFRTAELALKLGDTNFACHKWYAIMLDYVGEYEGTKERISKAFKIKEHFVRAVELNPKDATSVHLLGYWCFVFADMPWYQQKIASVIFATPPTSSYKEALDYFLQAEETDPGFYSMNLMMIGKTCMRMKDKDRAVDYLTKARNCPVRTEDDKKAHTEAVELLQQLGVK